LFLSSQERFESEVECSPTAFTNDGPIPLYSSLSAPRTTTTGPKSKKSSHGRFVGENRNLEKPYLRLTDYPKKEAVRPLEVVIKSLAHIKSRYCQEEDFEWANEQLKSVRQDLTVQAIRNKFVLDVYETHARILLEHGDLNEFNQCQTVIRTLTQGSVGLEKDTTDSSEYFQGELAALCCEEDSDDKALRQSDISADEFRGYGFLYALVRNSWSDLKTELVRTRETLAAVVKDENHSHSDRTSNCMHALQVVTAVNANDYRNFFRLYDSAPYMSAYLMDFLVKRVRDSAFERIIAAYRPTVSVEHFRECLFFQDLDETRLFLQESGAVFVQEKGEPLFFVDCKASGTSGKKSDPRLY
jgi:hypothetical protein